MQRRDPFHGFRVDGLRRAVAPPVATCRYPCRGTEGGVGIQYSLPLTTGCARRGATRSTRGCSPSALSGQGENNSIRGLRCAYCGGARERVLAPAVGTAHPTTEPHLHGGHGRPYGVRRWMMRNSSLVMPSRSRGATMSRRPLPSTSANAHLPMVAMGLVPVMVKACQ